METFEIKVRVADESELYNPFDPDKLTLNEDLLQYLVNRYSERELGKQTALAFVGAEINGNHLKAALRRHVESELEKNRREKKLNYAKQLRRFQNTKRNKECG